LVEIIGAGPAGMKAAECLAKRGVQVRIYDHKNTAGRKFLVAGDGGFNLTHHQPLELFLSNYDAPKIQDIVRQFDNQQTVEWLKEIGIETFVGSSGKIFPVKGTKPIDVLNAWVNYLKSLGVVFYFNHRLVDFDEDKLTFETPDSRIDIQYERAIFAFGGQSWSKTGSDGAWTTIFREKGIPMTPFSPSNSGFEMEKPFSKLEGIPLKNCAVYFNDVYRKGELVFTAYGIEGGAIYYLNRFVRKFPFPQTILLDLKPSLSLEQVTAFLTKGKPTEQLKKLKITGAKLELIKTLDKKTFTTPHLLSHSIKMFPLKITGFRPLNEVISSYGGVKWEAMNEQLFLVAYPRIQCCGEMLDWDAPTGGYLLQGCFASGHFVGSV
jgi:uncharacterized flavoprotein (TIGR03862 family)